MKRPRESLGIDWRPDAIRAVRLERRLGGVRWREAVTLPREGEVGARLGARLGPVAGAVVVGLPGREGFLRRPALPAEDPSLLRPLVEFDVERHVPLPVEKLAFDFTVLGRGEGNRWDLLLAAAPRQAVEASVETLAGGGVRPSGVTLTPLAIAGVAALAGAPPGPGLAVEAARGALRAEVLEAGRSLWQQEQPLPRVEADLTPALRALGEEARRAVRVRWVLWMGEGPREPIATWAREAGLACLNPFKGLRGAPAHADPAYTAALALALQGLGMGPWRLNLLAPSAPAPRQALGVRAAAGALLLAAGLGAGIWLNEYRLDRRALAKDLAKLERLAPRVRVVEAESGQAAALRRLLEELARVEREPSKLALLRELTVLTPRHTWLTRLTYRRGELEIAGYSGSPQEMIPRLEASLRFQQAGFSGTIEREGSQERFTIRARLQ